MAKKIELFKGVFVTDINDRSLGPMCIVDETQFDRNWYASSYPEQKVRDHVGKAHGYAVMSSHWNPETKDIIFEVMVNAQSSIVNVVSYKSICELYGWKSFTFADGGLIEFEKLPFEEFEKTKTERSSETAEE